MVTFTWALNFHSGTRNVCEVTCSIVPGVNGGWPNIIWPEAGHIERWHSLLGVALSSDPSRPDLELCSPPYASPAFRMHSSELMDNPGRIESLVEAARRHSEQLSLEVFARRLEEVLRPELWTM